MGGVTNLPARRRVQARTGGVDIKELGRLRALLPIRQARSGDDKWNMRGTFPKRILAGNVLLTQMPAMVGEQNDDGVVRMG